MLFWFRSENKKSETFLKTAEKYKGKFSNGYLTVLIRYWSKIPMTLDKNKEWNHIFIIIFAEVKQIDTAFFDWSPLSYLY